MMKKIMGITIKMKHTVKPADKAMVDFDQLWAMVNIWRDKGAPEAKGMKRGEKERFLKKSMEYGLFLSLVLVSA